MDVFLSEIFSFPTLIFTIPLIVLMLFWLLAFAGLVDIEIFDMSPDVDADASSNVKADATGSSFLESLGLDGVPLTVALTIIDIYAFALVYLLRKYLAPLFDGVLSATAIGGILALVSLVIALPLAALSIKPLRRFFVTYEGANKDEMIGLICILTTQKVTSSFGQAVTPDGQTLSVRAQEPNDMLKGSRIALIDFDKITDTYIVVSETELMAMSSSSLPLNN
ncbi:OB-fold-containig protein [Aliiglaciecola sp. LCG003]|uniref:OB-fold-containig protein n=1 Tax=Aliiglaciecola sp. LCG003 TaxID=3053655 RepID=UPI0025726F3B|nr:OB-fold-containig protein [Aliiglaciecola sp. LCG003]WJG10059.1 DUF1449 family protein [Aliiglaciecola sp. LCG003]